MEWSRLPHSQPRKVLQVEAAGKPAPRHLPNPFAACRLASGPGGVEAHRARASGLE